MLYGQSVLRLAVVVVVLSAVLAGPAMARERVGRVVSGSTGLATAKTEILPPVQPGTLPSDRPADGQLWEEVKIAREYWAARGVTGCGTIDAEIAAFPWQEHLSAEENDVYQASAVGWSPSVGSCKVRLVPSFAELTRVDTEYFELRHECAIVVHEIGHALGLEHDDPRFPLMGEASPHDQFDGVIPGRCSVWARKIVRERRGR